jgi:hypothetical protein
MDQFFYKTNLMGGKLGSFSLSKVIRTIEKENGSLLVLLDDGHEQPVPTQRPIGNKGKVETIRVREWIQSEIILSPKDAQRYYDLHTDQMAILKKDIEQERLETEKAKVINLEKQKELIENNKGNKILTNVKLEDE